MTPEIETLLTALKSAHSKYLESLKNFTTQEDIDFHTNESNQRFSQLLKEIEEKNFDVVLIKDSIALLESAVADALKDSEEENNAAKKFGKGLCSRGCLESLLREYARATTTVIATKNLEPVMAETCELLTTYMSNTIIDLLKLAQSEKTVEETRKEAHARIGETERFLSIITSAIREGTFDVIDLRAKDGKMQYN
jgi:hypothetical protein